eukprot:TRINITY_DN42824_c0_g1_i1.p1 TRINITY_DN42824_c0_g1~~TRINITY_DN42824_c0_g1_i1.p1  ORF type:complete len:427 (+),score=130.93 TRINITY_DN42824_c0_g1_i1:172-1452(+)
MASSEEDGDLPADADDVDEGCRGAITPPSSSVRSPHKKGFWPSIASRQGTKTAPSSSSAQEAAERDMADAVRTWRMLSFRDGGEEAFLAPREATASLERHLFGEAPTPKAASPKAQDIAARDAAEEALPASPFFPELEVNLVPKSTSRASRFEQLHGRIAAFLETADTEVAATVAAEPTPRRTKESSQRKLLVGLLLVHLTTVYELLEGMQVAFIWKVPSVQKQDPLLLTSMSDLLFGGASYWQHSSSAKPPIQKQEDLRDYVAAACTVALSSCLTQLEVHRSHEVTLVPLDTLEEVRIGLDAGSSHDACCVILRLHSDVGERRLVLRLPEGTARPFAIVVLALAAFAAEAFQSLRPSQCLVAATLLASLISAADEAAADHAANKAFDDRPPEPPPLQGGGGGGAIFTPVKKMSKAVRSQAAVAWS